MAFSWIINLCTITIIIQPITSQNTLNNSNINNNINTIDNFNNSNGSLPVTMEIMEKSPQIQEVQQIQTKTKQRVEIKCTPNCVCDHFHGARRAVCVDKKMVYIKDNIPRRTQILDFSFNYVTKIHEDEFHDNELNELKILNVSNNKISQIDIFAFESISEVEILDLSHNALQYILQEWFWDLGVLKEVHLQHNNLGRFQDAPLFNSATLNFLNLSSCQIPQIFDSSFSEMPQLTTFDLSDNYLISMRITTVSHLEHLEQINLHKNPIKCNNLEEFLAFLDENSIGHKTDCVDDHGDYIDEDFELIEAEDTKNHRKQQNQNKFEKMIDISSNNTKNSNNSKEQMNPNENIKQKENEEKEEETAWIFEETLTNHGIQQEECPQECFKDCPETHKNVLVEIIELSPIIVLATCIGIGFIMGLMIGCFCKCNRRRPRRRNVKPMHRVSRSFSFRGGEARDRQFLIDL